MEVVRGNEWVEFGMYMLDSWKYGVKTITWKVKVKRQDMNIYSSKYVGRFIILQSFFVVFH